MARTICGCCWAVRFAAQLGFEIEPETFSAIQRLAPKIQIISAERIREELVKLFALPAEGLGEEVGSPKDQNPSPRPSPRLGRAREKNICAPAARGWFYCAIAGCWRKFCRNFFATIGCEQSPDFHPEGSVFNHICLMLKKLPPGADELLPWTVLLHDIAKPVTAEKDPATGAIHFYGHEKVGAEMAETILRRLKFTNHDIETVVTCVKNHMQFKDVPQMRKATLRRLLLRETFPLELELHKLDCLGSNGDLGHYDFCVAAAEELKQQPEIIPPLLNGNDLLALGVPAGKKIGELLHELRDKQLAEELKTADEARTWSESTKCKSGIKNFVQNCAIASWSAPVLWRFGVAGWR